MVSIWKPVEKATKTVCPTKTVKMQLFEIATSLGFIGRLPFAVFKNVIYLMFGLI